MSETRTPPSLIRVSERPEAQGFAHPLNPRSEMHGVSLSHVCGLTRLGVHLVRIPPGKEANTYHSHSAEEEFVFILEGKGLAEIDGFEHQVGPGDFLGFTAPSPPHQLRNPFDDDLVYLVGGERRDLEFAELPRLGKHIVRVGGQAWSVDTDALKPFWKQDTKA